MQIDVNGGKYDERVSSEDDRYSYSIIYDPKLKLWFVDCWVEATGENHWNRTFRDEDKALAEYKRFP